MNFIIGGDVVPTPSNMNLFKDGNAEQLMGAELYSLWNNADFRIFNLETPLVDEESPIEKNGPNLIAPTSSITGIKNLNPSLVTLANNHILDQGNTGLKVTEDILEEEGIPYIGAGANLKIAEKPYIFHNNGIKIGVYTCAEREFTIANHKTPGANPFDPLESLDHIENLKNKCDYVIVLYHGGKEYYRYPSPYLQKVCRKMAKKGADLIICQHSHCIGCFEEFESSTIVYGQGNFIFDKSDSEYWKTSILINVNINHDGIQLKYIPLVKKGNGIRLATDQIANNILSKFQIRSQEILEDGFVERKYSEFSQNEIYSYLRKFSGSSKWISRIDRRLLNGWLIKKRYSQEKLLQIENFIECEAHRELVLTGLRGVRTGGR